MEVVRLRPDATLPLCVAKSDSIPATMTPCRSRLSVSKSDLKLPFRVLAWEPGPRSEKLLVSVLSEELLSVSSLTTDSWALGGGTWGRTGEDTLRGWSLLRWSREWDFWILLPVTCRPS